MVKYFVFVMVIIINIVRETFLQFFEAAQVLNN